MAVSADHLNDSAKAALELSDEDRIARVRKDRWIKYTRAEQILSKLDDLLIYPKTHRTPNLLIVGDTNNGKTMIINRFYNKHLPDDNIEADHIHFPVMVIQAPPIPDEGRFYNAILDRFAAPYRFNDRPAKKLIQVITISKQVDLRMLIIDEIQHIIAGHMSKQRQFLNVIKYLGNELRIPIIGVGTKEAHNALQTDPQLANRFEPARLPKWEIGEEYRRLLASFERALPLRKPSGLKETDIAIKLHSMSEGLIGELSTILKKAATQAIKKKTEQIDSKVLKLIDWIQPSARKRLDRA
jgi:hypothetical protein